MAGNSINILLLTTVLLPFIAALLIYGFRKWLKNFSGELSVGILLIVVIIASALINQVQKTSTKIIYGIYNTTAGKEFGPPTGVQFRVDQFSSWFLLLFNIIIIFVLIFETVNQRKKPGGSTYTSILLFLVAGINAVIITYDFFTMIIAWVIIGIALIVMISFWKREEDIKEGSVRIYAMVGVSIAFLILAAVLLYGVYQSLNFDYVKTNLATLLSGRVENLQLIMNVIIALIIGGFGIFIQMFLLNLWMPKTIEKAPTSAKIFVIGIISGLAVLSMFRTLFSFFSPDVFTGTNYSVVLASIGLLTAAEGAFLVINQILRKKNISFTKVISYSAFVNLGIIITGISMNGLIEKSPEMLSIIDNCVGYSYILIINLAAAMALSYISGAKISTHYNDTDNLLEMKGAIRELPITTATLTIALLSSIGIMPTIGGVANYMLIFSLFEAGKPVFGIIILIILAMVLTCYLLILKIILFDKSVRGINYQNAGFSYDLSLPTVAVFLLALTIIILGFMPGIISHNIVEGITLIL
ncbi:MAG: proton-conducting transporter transmembrane domain-containing protein [Candidatus Heimdallarchaeota archaeon]